MASGGVQRRGERRGEGVERRPPGEAERDASRAEDNVPIDARTGRPVEPPPARAQPGRGDQPRDPEDSDEQD
jgi:hypothetical protein